MRGIVAALAVLALLSGQLFGQSATGSATFDIADVHAGSRSPTVNMTGGLLKGDRYELHNATMVDLIRTAYSVDAEKVLGGPSWLELDRFTIAAKAPESTPLPTLKLMVRSLLADRFKLVLHEDTKTMSTFVLTVAGATHKMKVAAGPGPGCQGQPQQNEPGVIPIQVGVCRGVTMAAFADLLPRAFGAYVTSPVTDQTGLKDAYDFEIRVHPRQLLAQAGSEGISLFDALEKQLGLKLEEKQLPATALVVDSVNRTPTPNSPEVAKALPPPPPPEFEVATIRPTDPATTGTRAQIQPTGMVNVSGMPLKQLVRLAWDLNHDDLIDAPKWMENSRFDIVARAFASTKQLDMPPIEIDTLRQMVRTLLIERFKMKMHFEDRPVSAYTMTVSDKPKLTKADPAGRTRCFDGPAPGAPDLRNKFPTRNRLITCQNITMPLFAERLFAMANGYVQIPILDKTGLEGGWDLAVNFSGINIFQGNAGRGGDAGPAAGAGGGAFAASDPNGAISLSEALDKQLGLKLEMQKRPVPVLVIDSIAEKPTDN
ncbi:MAG TPA: TIGR03435 family protein [Vicinamibacterales bacterium]|jgi:uncharacterized protein (TIGR03435 family)